MEKEDRTKSEGKRGESGGRGAEGRGGKVTYSKACGGNREPVPFFLLIYSFM